MAQIKVGIIGGTGLDNPDIMGSVTEKIVATPFGMPSDSLKLGDIDGVSCVLLARHCRDHSVAPSHINYRANIWALKEVGCTHIIVSTACGSLREEIRPGELILIAGAEQQNLAHHKSGTTVCIEGPRFSTKAESNLYRSWGAQVVNMTTVPEATLAKELGLCYAAVAIPTDYDCWRDDEESVSVDLIMKTLKENAEKATKVIRYAVKHIQSEDWTEYLNDLERMVRGSLVKEEP